MVSLCAFVVVSAARTDYPSGMGSKLRGTKVGVKKNHPKKEEATPVNSTNITVSAQPSKDGSLGP